MGQIRVANSDSSHNISKTYDQTGGTFGYGQGVGHLTTMTDQAGTMNRQFDERGNIVHHQRLNGLTQIDTYAAFDQNNRMWEFVYPDQWMLLLYRDNAGQMTEIDSIQQSGPWVYTGGVPVVSSVTHLPFGPVSGLSFHNGLTKTNSFDFDYRMTETKDAATSSVMDLSYTYDGNGNPTAITDAVNPANSMTTTATGQGYDKDDRFLGATSGTGGYGNFTYTYDANGNRSTETQNGTTMTYTYNSGTNQIYGFNDSNNTNYVYNGAGEITKQYYGTYYDHNYVPDVQEQLYTPISESYGLPSFYAYYNGFGQREAKSSNVYWNYSYDFDGRLSEESNTGGQKADYVYLDGQPVALNEITGAGGMGMTENTYYVHADRLGTPQAVTDGSKTVQWKQLYQPFGLSQSLTNTGNIVQDLLFPGQVYDSETNRPYNGSRYYNPHTGAYMYTDRLDILQSGTTNNYTYAGSNPFRFMDRTGLFVGPVPTITTVASETGSIGVGGLLGPMVVTVAGVLWPSQTASNDTYDSGGGATGDWSSYIHYGYAADACLFANGLRPGSFATQGPIMTPEEAQQTLALPATTPPDSYYTVNVPDTVAVMGPLSVAPTVVPPRTGGGTEFQFPFGTPPGSVSGPYPLPRK